MSTLKTQARSTAALRFNAPSKVASALLCALSLSAATAQANPLMILGGINGVVDAVKRTAGSVATATKSAPKPAAKPRISLPGAHRIARGMQRDAVVALVGEPEQANAQSRRAGVIIDVYKVKREGSCTIDLVEISYASKDGVVQDIAQKCGDVTSDENRDARYSFQLEYPAVFDKLSPKMPRDQVIAILGAPTDTRASNLRSHFIDVYTVDGEQTDVWYDKRDKLAYEFYWSGRSVTWPRIQRADLFEPIDRP